MSLAVTIAARRPGGGPAAVDVFVQQLAGQRFADHLFILRNKRKVEWPWRVARAVATMRNRVWPVAKIYHSFRARQGNALSAMRVGAFGQ